VGGEHVHVRVEVGQVPEGLHEQDQPRARTSERLGVRLDQQSRSNAAKLPQPRPLLPEGGAQKLRDGEQKSSRAVPDYYSSAPSRLKRSEKMTLAETIYQRSLKLPDAAAQEALDFIEFLNQRYGIAETANVSADGDAAAYDAWFKAQVNKAILDPRPGIPAAIAREHFAARRDALRRQSRTEE